MVARLLSTGKAARLYSVAPDTVLKWIKSGLLSARRTAGGHYRIDPEDLQRILSPNRQHPAGRNKASPQRRFRYCWEYNGKGELLESCRECIVYQMRARRCYAVKLAPEFGHIELFCKESCKECEYYQRVREQATNVLVVTDNEVITASLRQDAELPPYRLEVTDCEYKCSALVEVFRPDYVVLACSLGAKVNRDIFHHLIQDPRIPYVRIIMAADKDELPDECDQEVFACIEKPFCIADITECIHGAAA